MKVDQLTTVNKIAIFLLLATSIAYHVILGMSSVSNKSLFNSGIEFSTHAVRQAIEPITGNMASPLTK